MHAGTVWWSVCPVCLVFFEARTRTCRREPWACHWRRQQAGLRITKAGCGCQAQLISAWPEQGSVTPTQSPLKPASTTPARAASSFSTPDLMDVTLFLLHTARQAACAWKPKRKGSRATLSDADVVLHHDALACLRDLLDQHPQLQGALLQGQGAGELHAPGS